MNPCGGIAAFTCSRIVRRALSLFAGTRHTRHPPHSLRMENHWAPLPSLGSFPRAMKCTASSVALTVAFMDSTYMKRYNQHSMFLFLAFTLRNFLSPRGSAQRRRFRLSAVPLRLSTIPLVNATGYRMGFLLFLVANSIFTLEEFVITISFLRLGYNQIACARTLGIGRDYCIQVLRKVSQLAYLWDTFTDVAIQSPSHPADQELF